MNQTLSRDDIEAELLVLYNMQRDQVTNPTKGLIFWNNSFIYLISYNLIFFNERVDRCIFITSEKTKIPFILRNTFEFEKLQTNLIKPN
jgi:hypothetical protein